MHPSCRIFRHQARPLAGRARSYGGIRSGAEPELAESWTVSDDGLVLTFKLKPDAKFWDGRKVSAADVKWSFDRAVSVGGFPTVTKCNGEFGSGGLANNAGTGASQ